MRLSFIESNKCDYIVRIGNCIVFTGTNRDKKLREWEMEPSKNRGFYEFLTSVHDFLYMHSPPIKLKWKIEIGEWIFDWMYDHEEALWPEVKKQYYELACDILRWKRGSANDDDLVYKVKLYLRILVNTENSFSALTGLDREEEIKSVLYKDSSKGILNDSFEADRLKGENIRILTRVAEWFLRRNDLETARDLFKASDRLSRRGEQSEKKNRQSINTINTKLASRIYSSIKRSKLLVCRFIVLSLLLTALIVIAFGIEIKLDAGWTMTVCLSLIYLIILFWPVIHHFRHKEEPWLFKLALPRMAGAIVVGYIALITQDAMWKLAYKVFTNWDVLFLSIFFGLFASFMYLYTQVKKIIGRKKTIRRTLNILITGLIETITFGLIMCHLISKYFSPESLDICDEIPCALIVPVKVFRRWEMYPQVLLLFAPLALFVGIFVQMLWEDKPISEPL